MDSSPIIELAKTAFQILRDEGFEQLLKGGEIPEIHRALTSEYKEYDYPNLCDIDIEVSISKIISDKFFYSVLFSRTESIEERRKKALDNLEFMAGYSLLEIIESILSGEVPKMDDWIFTTYAAGITILGENSRRSEILINIFSSYSFEYKAVRDDFPMIWDVQRARFYIETGKVSTTVVYSVRYVTHSWEDAVRYTSIIKDADGKRYNVSDCGPISFNENNHSRWEMIYIERRSE